MLLLYLNKYKKITDTEFVLFAESLRSVKVIFTNKKYL